MKKKLIFLSIVTSLLFAGCNDKLEASEIELIRKISELETKAKQKMDSLVIMCSDGDIIEYRGYFNPREKAEEILSLRKQAHEYRKIMETSVIRTEKYIRKTER